MIYIDLNVDSPPHNLQVLSLKNELKMRAMRYALCAVRYFRRQ